MVRYFELLPLDGEDEIWLFSENDENDRLVLRPEYRELACDRCGKLDEARALREIGIARLEIESDRQFLGTSDEFIMVGRTFQEAYETLGLNGLEFLEVPGSSSWSVVLPSVVMDVDPALAGFEIHGGHCSRCGRAREATVGPLMASITKPEDPMSVFTANAWSESVKGRRLHLFCSEAVAQGLKRSCLKGLELLEAL